MEMLSRVMEFYYNPFLLSDMEKALHRIVAAVNKREKIVIYGHHDLDSITAISLLLLVLNYVKADVEYFIPDDEKKGLNEDVVENHIKFLGASLIITVGCGTSFSSEVELCKKFGIDLIITDYHKSNSLPSTIIVNPNKIKCTYPCKDLCGVGVVYKLVQALSVYYNMKYVNKYLDLVMLGTIFKSSKIVNENKTIVDMGIQQLKNTNNYGLKALIKVYKVMNINRESINKLIFDITPALNVTKYINNAKIAVELFTTSDNDRAEQIAKYFKNQTRVMHIYL
jgi:single-stranded DNA-specific DHH superfamily exonuclease